MILLALFLTLSPLVSSINSFVYSGGYFEVRTSETARAVLTSILGGIISLTVFGFSMMMVVVNQAASNYSPKVVDTLISQRSNQYILGVNLGTIVFALIVMMHIDNRKADGGIPELAILVAVMFAIYCLLLFVRFINNISNAVRINNIINVIYRKTRHSITHQNRNHVVPEKTDISNWTMYTAGHSGYFQLLRSNSILEILGKEDAVLKVLPLPGTYYLRHEPLFAVSKALRRDVVDRIRASFVTYNGEPISENPVYGFRQLREIAVKALSPGINDPGVAILCIDHLAELLSMELDRQPEYSIKDAHDKLRIIRPEYDFAALFELSLLPIKHYGRSDFVVLGSLLHAVYQVALADTGRRVRTLLSSFTTSLLELSKERINDTAEQDVLKRRFDEMRKLGYFDPSDIDAAK